MRIEDTDAARNKPEYEADIIAQLNWLNLTPDETYKQSEYLERHKQAMQTLIEADRAYISKEKAKDGSGKDVEVVRLRNPGESVSFNDLVRGEITFDTKELGDFVIARSIEEPLYHLAVVVDDADANITHIIRGEEHISNTPRQILIQRALDLPQPQYAHLPLILAPDKSKLSKRKHASFATVQVLREQGFLSEALVNFLALMGWHPKDDTERLTLHEIIQQFAVADIQKGGAIFDIEKLRWLNREYLLELPEEEFATACLAQLEHALKGKYDEETAKKLLPLLRERISVFGDIAELAADGEFDYFFEVPDPDPEKLPWKDSSQKEAREHLQALYRALKDLPESAFLDSEAIKTEIWPYAEEKGRGAVLWPFRYCLTGREKSPDPFTVAAILGKEETLRRLEKNT